MKKYRVSGHVTISVCVVVEARSEAEARRKAEDAQCAALCNGCSTNNDDDSEWTAEALDGEPTITSVEEES